MCLTWRVRIGETSGENENEVVNSFLEEDGPGGSTSSARKEADCSPAFAFSAGVFSQAFMSEVRFHQEATTMVIMTGKVY